MDFDMQIRAIRYAIKELNRELIKAHETKDKEWEYDAIEYISDLEDAIKSIEAMKALSAVLKG